MTSRVVAVDTTAEWGSLALIHDGELLEEVALHSPDGFGHVLFPHLEALLARHAWAPGAVDCYAAAAGPGSFTGIRVGLAAVKGLGQALGTSVAAVSNLQAIAWHGSAPLRACVLDARRGEVYGAVYNALLEPLSAEVVAGFARWVESLPQGELELLSPDFSAFASALSGTRLANVPLIEIPRRLAGAVGCIAAKRMAARFDLQPSVADANYVRRSDAELFWKDH